MSPIFIISQHRTGSTLLKNMLDAHSEITMAFDEMNLFEFRRDNSLDKLISNTIQNPVELVEVIQQQKIYGTFWQEFEKSGIKKEELKTALENEEFTLNNILKAILTLLAFKNNTMHSGVKYPLHFSKAHLLKEWFPSCKIIFLTRNPKAIIASKLNDPATKERKNKSIMHRFGVHYLTLFYFAIEYKKSIQQWSKNRKEYHKVTYKELVQNQTETLTKICKHCNLDFEGQMLQVGGKESSFTQKKANKPVTHSLEKYKTTLSKFDQWLIGRLTNKSYKKVNQ